MYTNKLYGFGPVKIRSIYRQNEGMFSEKNNGISEKVLQNGKDHKTHCVIFELKKIASKASRKLSNII